MMRETRLSTPVKACFGVLLACLIVLALSFMTGCSSSSSSSQSTSQGSSQEAASTQSEQSSVSEESSTSETTADDLLADISVGKAKVVKTTKPNKEKAIVGKQVVRFTVKNTGDKTLTFPVQLIIVDENGNEDEEASDEVTIKQRPGDVVAGDFLIHCEAVPAELNGIGVTMDCDYVTYLKPGEQRTFQMTAAKKTASQSKEYRFKAQVQTGNELNLYSTVESAEEAEMPHVATGKQFSLSSRVDPSVGYSTKVTVKNKTDHVFDSVDVYYQEHSPGNSPDSDRIESWDVDDLKAGASETESIMYVKRLLGVTYLKDESEDADAEGEGSDEDSEDAEDSSSSDVFAI
ncbi:MAG: hypothetical protein ACOX1O_04835 [Eggerthellaceae bacterium]|jgi:hypothetical protein